MQQKADVRSAGTDMDSLRARIERLNAQVDRLRSQVEEAQRREQLLSDITRYLVPGSRPSGMLSNVLSLVMPYTGADTGSVLLLSEHGQVVSQLSQQAHRPKGDRTPQHTPQQALNDGLIAWAIKNAQATIVADTRSNGRWTEHPTRGTEQPTRGTVQSTDENGARSVLALPLRRGGQVHGLILLAHSKPNHFCESHLSALSLVADQVATALENARLFGRVRGERATLEAILTGTDDVIIVTDPEDRILLLNPAACKAFLDCETPQRGSPLAQVVKNEVLLGLWDDVTGQEPCSDQVPLPDGRTLYASLTLIPNVGKVAVMQDISRLKELDQIKSEFVSTVSHDLRSPLQAIQTSAELLPRMGELTREQNREVIHIQAIVRRMSRLVQDLLDIGRIEAGIGMEAEACAIDEIIASAAGSCKGLAREKGLDFEIDLPRTLPLVEGNSLRLDQVVSNLVNNAIKFTPEGSVTVRAEATDGYVLMEVIDTGIGIPPEAQDMLFQKFYRVKSPETHGIRGTGLGLAIVKSIVESYGGQIELESFPRLGSTFRVAFPICEDKPV
jgi:signal transduction histidine kinase